MIGSWLFGALLMMQAAGPDRYLLWKSERNVPTGPYPVAVVAPVFPEGLTTGAKGETVALDVEVDAAGRVSRSVVVGLAENQVAAQSALRALVQWRFEHGTQASRPIRVVITYRTMPVGTAPDQLTTIFRDKYEVEVRKVRGERGLPASRRSLGFVAS